MVGSKKLLLVDDDLIKFSRILSDSLGVYGVELAMAKDYGQALKQAQETCFDLIIIDVGLFGPFTGIDLLKAIRNMNAAVPVYVLTAYGNQYRNEAEIWGATRYLMKPLDPKKHILEPLGIAL